MPLEKLYEMANKGALALGFAMFVWLVWYYTNKVAPAISDNTKAISGLSSTVSENQKVNEKLIENNASAFRELAFSNQNVAKALELLTRTMEQQDGTLERHESQASTNFNTAFTKLDEHGKAIDGIKMDLARHTMQCDARYSRTLHP